MIEQLLDYVKNSPYNVLDDFSSNSIEELVRALTKKGDVKTAEGESFLEILTNELEKRKGSIK